MADAGVIEPRTVATLIWRRLDVAGLEHFRLLSTGEGHRLEGTIVLVHELLPLRVEYEIVCSPAWETRRVTVGVIDGESTRRLGLVVDERQRWWAHRTELTALAGCHDVDISLSPATNTLPIRRLGLLEARAGEAHDVTAAWVRFPQLTIEPLPQRYAPLGSGRVRYESSGGRFAAELDVDRDGLVLRYPPLWERVG